MKKILSLLLALGLAGCGAGQNAAPQSEAAAPAPANTAGEVHLLTPATPAQYETTVEASELLYRFDYAAATATLACTTPGCPHDTPACPAYAPPGGCYWQLDGDTLYRISRESTGEGEQRTLRDTYALWQAPADGSPMTQLATGLDCCQMSLYGSPMAADEKRLYLLGQPLVQDEKDPHPQTLKAIDKATGAVTEIGGLPDAGDDFSYLMPDTAQGRTLWLTKVETEQPEDSSMADGLINAVVVYPLDLDTAALGEPVRCPYTGLVCYETQENGEVWRHYTGYTCTLGDGRLAQVDTAAGTIRVVDLATGAETLQIRGLPTGGPELETTYSLQPLGAYYQIQVTQWPRTAQGQWTGEEYQDLVYMAAPDGTLTGPMPQYQYNPDRGTQPVQLLGLQDGLLLAQYEVRTTDYTAPDPSGTMTEYTDYQFIYGTISLQDYLAGSSDFREMTVGEGN